MSGLSPAQVDVAAAVFRNLVTTSGAKIALTAEDLADLSGLPVSAVQDLLETLCSGPQRILRPLPPAVGVAGPLRYEIFHDVMGAAVLDWRQRYVMQRHQAESSRRLIAEREEARAAARTASRGLRLTVVLAVMTLAIGALGALTYISYRITQQQKLQFLLLQTATTLAGNPELSLKLAVDAYNINANDDTREAVLTAASSPRSRVVVGPNPMMAGMVLTPDSRHVVAYDARGGIRVIGDNGAVEREATASGLRGTVIRSPRAVAVSPDASQVALGTDQGTVAIIDTATGGHRDIDTQGGTTPSVSWVGSASNGLVLVVAGNVAATYSPDTGKQVASFPGVVDAVPLADDQHIVTSGEDGKLRVWDARTAVPSAESSPLAAAPRFLRRYGQSVVGVVEGAHSSIVVWSGHAGSDPAAYPVQYSHAVKQVSVGERAGTISIGDGKEVWTYSLRNGSPQGRLPQQADWIYDMETSPDSQWLTTASVDGGVRVWSLGHQRYPSQPTYELLAHHGPVRRARYLRDGKAVMSLGKDGMILYWELPQVPRFDQHTDWVVGMELSRDGSLLATASADGQVFIIDPHDVMKAPVGTVSTRPGLRDMFLDPTDPHRIVTLVWGAPASAPELWRWGGDGKAGHLQTYAIPPLPESEPLLSLAISPDGTMVAGGDNRGTVHFWDARTGALRADHRFRGAGQPTTVVRFDPSGHLLATADQYGVRLWKLGTAQPLALLPHPNAGWVAFDPSGEHLASAARDGTVKIWTREGKLYNQFAAHGQLSSSPSFSGDGKLLAVGTAEGLVEVRDVQSGRTVMLDSHHGASVNSVAFLPGDPSRLISASDDTTVAQFSCPACTDPDGVIREAVEWAKGH
jgi:WD40 repeat protein